MKRLVHWMIAATLALAAGFTSAAEVVLGPGDVVKASVYGSPDLATETRVSEAGSMTFPLLGEVQVGGLTTQQAEKKIGGLLEKGGYLKKAQVNLLITTLASQQVSVLGQVNRPGRYPVEGKRKVLDLLAIAGGVNADGSDMVSLVRTRNGQTTRETIDIVDMVRKGELNRDYEVAGGDIIFVERAPRAYITGEVNRPGPFRVERAMTVQQAVSAGGGLTQRGTQRGLRVTRKDANGVAHTIDVKNDDLVQMDDVITVKESWF
ncbi:sugar transporter [Massilia sp. WF1]|uniref:polysaccharide export protein EpsE n=1 Tax=unclassified Massilia TaxID=2609279 RepID=UPI0006495F79|nr:MULTISPECIES: polysaccharide export protein EpsE [unclassified Massilia]ALK96332.1 polysaccharide export protein EpsE [Massilia sp. WG5]KLU37683.1 sugar transporter [Massilia sp. WF1]